MSTKSASPSLENTLPITVANTAFLLDRLGEDCHPLQFLRELTQNSIESILRTEDKIGEIVWDVDWQQLTESGRYKLCITDNGQGMNGDELVNYINALSSSGSEQSFDGNFGVGAKISAATRNHAGLLYLSWRSGKGAMIHLWRDPHSKRYGLRQFELPDGTFEYCASIADEAKPEAINDHGTRVVLVGMSESSDTMVAPPTAAAPSRWVAKYLNGRYYRFPEGVVVKAREGWTAPRSDKDRNVLRTITGQAQYLSKHSATSGKVRLTNATAHWWILRDEKTVSQYSGSYESAGHTAALHNNELYELQNGRSATARLQNFGVILGHKWVVIYLEPDETTKVTTNTARTYLSINNEPLPWADWAAEFREKMPPEISELVKDAAAGTSEEDHGRSIRERLQQLIDLYKLSRYKPTADGSLSADPDVLAREKRLQSDEPREVVRRILQHKKEGAAGGAYSAYLKKDGIPAAEVTANLFPTVIWISVKTKTREPGDLEDRAARFLMDQNTLIINADFRVFTDMIDLWNRELGKGEAVKKIVTVAVRNWFQQALEETVIGIRALQKSREWSDDDILKAISEESLTAAVMQRYHVYNSVKRELGSKLGKINAA